jgi:hypothetical protein
MVSTGLGLLPDTRSSAWAPLQDLGWNSREEGFSFMGYVPWQGVNWSPQGLPPRERLLLMPAQGGGSALSGEKVRILWLPEFSGFFLLHV